MHFEDLDTQSFLSNLRSGVTDGGLTVTQDMRDILDQPGFITLAKGSQKLRKSYSFRAPVLVKRYCISLIFSIESMSFDATRLSPLGFACFFGRLDLVLEVCLLGFSALDIKSYLSVS